MPPEKSELLLVTYECIDSIFFIVLTSLTSTLRSSPLDKYISGDFREDLPPAYLQDPKKERGKNLAIELPGFSVAPRITDDGTDFDDGLEPLDGSQRDALKRILSSELVLVQGPPGTGKSYTSLVALGTLASTFEPSTLRPIIVAAQSNFALDQLLVHCHKANIRVTRLGNRSQDALLSELTLANLRRRVDLNRRKIGHEGARKRLIRNIDAVFRSIFSTGGILVPSELCREGIITPAQRDSLGTTFDENYLDNSTDEDGDDDDACDDDDEDVDQEYPDQKKETDQTEKKTCDGPPPPPEQESPSGVFVDWLGDQIQRHPGMVYVKPTHQTEPDMEEEDVLTATRRFLKDSDETEAPQETYLPLKLDWTGYVAGMHDEWRMAARRALRAKDLYEITPNRRGMVYRYLQEQYLMRKGAQLAELLQQYTDMTVHIKAERAENDRALIEDNQTQIVGCTTTGLGIYRDLLSRLNPKVVFVEEAAETWEANISSCLFPSAQQLVLVGDHMQLTPKCDTQYLARIPYNLNTSLFERMVTMVPPIQHVTLNVQRRMIPELRGLLNPYYPNIQDHEDVLKLEKVPGMPVNTLFFHHTWLDTKTASGGRTNRHEARMLVGLYTHLVQNGVKSSEITVLTFYRNQVAVVIDMLAHDEWLQQHCSGNPIVRTVDGFQGEQSDVVILSMVRSAGSVGRHCAGFLRERNRVIVAISRARRGMYIFGDATNVLRDEMASMTWTPVVDYYDKRDGLKETITTKCQRHGSDSFFDSPEQWAYSTGGCSRPCGGITCDKSGHKCLLKCHP